MIGFFICMISLFEIAFTGNSSFIKDIDALGLASCIEFIFEVMSVMFFIAYRLYKD